MFPWKENNQIYMKYLVLLILYVNLISSLPALLKPSSQKTDKKDMWYLLLIRIMQWEVPRNH